METPLDRILPLVRELSATDLDRLVAECKALRQFAHVNSKPGSQVSGGSEAEQLLTVIIDYCRLYRVDLRPIEALRKNPYYRGFAEKAPEIMTYLQTFCRSRIERGMMLVEVFHYIKEEEKQPVTATLLMQQIHRVPAIIDRMFPGYVQSGLMSLIIRKPP